MYIPRLCHKKQKGKRERLGRDKKGGGEDGEQGEARKEKEEGVGRKRQTSKKAVRIYIYASNNK